MALALAVPGISLGNRKFKMGHVILTTPLLKAIRPPYARLDIAYLYTKFGISLQPFQRYGWCHCPPKFKWFT